MADAGVTTVEAETAASPRRPHRSDSPIAAMVAVLATIIGLVLLAWTVLYVTKGRFLKGTFERIATSQSGREVEVDGDFQLYFNPINIKFLAEGITVANPEWASGDNFFDARLIDTNIATIPLIFGNRRVNWLNLVDGNVDLEWDAAGRRNTWTFGDPNAKGEPLELPVIRRATLYRSDLRYRDPRMQLAADIAFRTVEARDTRFASEIGFSGTGSARGNPFTLEGALQSPNATLAGGENRLRLHAEGANTVMDVTGTLPGATELEGSRLRMDVRGANIADLFNLIGVAIPETRRYRVTSALTKAGDEWRFTGLKGTFGDSDVAGKLTVAMIEPRLKLTAEIATRRLDIIDAAPFIGYNPDEAARGASAVIERVNGTPRLLPDATLRIESLRNFDADLHWTVRQVRARSLPISNIDLTLGLDDRLLKLSPFTFSMARGTVSSDIVINARPATVVTDYDIRLSPTPMGVLLAGWGVEESGTSGTLSARVKLRGEGDSLRKSLATSDGRIAVILPRGTFWTRNVQLAELDVGTFIQKMFEGRLKEPVQINCGLIGFTVRNGIAAADPILIDTQKNVMLGRGGFSFRNESIDLAFRADSKKFSLFAGQSPVGVNGYFAEPGFDVISPELVGRAGAGLGLATVVTPLAAVVAFIDVGDAKSAACGPVLAGATARAQRTDKGEPRDDVGRGTTAKSEDGSRSKGERQEQRKKFLGIF
ncbi:AsmA family protein [Sphingomonas gilva]|uniref:AsmA family protein n=1 Tax=Sphingomonas gilva TaxID=2305907 RepID=A0A396RR37_9SPHN|nr:AsmA family protein [Sphingomonas gilva]RHW17752.1 AsmA family protein [Sphingomonas gilva]